MHTHTEKQRENILYSYYQYRFAFNRVFLKFQQADPANLVISQTPHHYMFTCQGHQSHRRLEWPTLEAPRHGPESVDAPESAAKVGDQRV